jgi:hypothetical protein
MVGRRADGVVLRAEGYFVGELLFAR